MKKILIIEDDATICQMLKDFFEKRQALVRHAPDGAAGIPLCKAFATDVILLDLMLPGESGEVVLQKLRAFTDAPVIVLSAKSMVQDKIHLLESGADDYMTKPFDLHELAARIEVHLKRAARGRERSSRIIYRDLALTDGQLTACGHAIALTATELKLLTLLMQYPDKIFSKQNLYESVWNAPYALDDDTINTHISRIRKKLRAATSDDYIQTIWGIGYKMR